MKHNDVNLDQIVNSRRLSFHNSQNRFTIELECIDIAENEQIQTQALPASEKHSVE